MRLLLLALVVAACTPAPAPVPPTSPAPAPPSEPSPPAPTTSAESADAFLRSLPALVAEDDSLARARDIAIRTAGVTVGSKDLEFAIDEPPDAKHVVSVLGVRGELFIVSTDADQRSWHLEVGRARDPQGHRIATDMPRIGSWNVEIRVWRRPEGPLPKLVARASPAYPLAERDARISTIRFRK